MNISESPQLESRSDINEMSYEDWQQIFRDAGKVRSPMLGVPEIIEGPEKEEIRSLLADLDTAKDDAERAETSKKIVELVNRHEQRQEIF